MGGTAIVGACENSDDLMALADFGGPDQARRTTATCGATWCSGTQDEATCVQNATTCIQTAIGVSRDCATCYADLAWCTTDLCNTACASNPCSSGCLTCGGGSYVACLGQLGDCTGTATDACEI